MDRREGKAQTTPTSSLEGLYDLLEVLADELDCLPGLAGLFGRELQQALGEHLGYPGNPEVPK